VGVGVAVAGTCDTVGVGVLPLGQPPSALLTAAINSLIATIPSPFTSNAVQVLKGLLPSAMLTPVMSSLMATVPSALQSPVHCAPARTGLMASTASGATAAKHSACSARRCEDIRNINQPPDLKSL